MWRGVPWITVLGYILYKSSPQVNYIKKRKIVFDEDTYILNRFEKNAIKAGASDEFFIDNWEGYPEGLPKPEGPFRILEGNEYKIVRAEANRANRSIHKSNPNLAGKDIHEIKPVKFGGSPTDYSNKVPLLRLEHSRYTIWWNALLKILNGG